MPRTRMPKPASPAAADPADAADRYRAPALDKGLDILELLAEQHQGLTRGEIVKAMGRSPSEIYRMLERLVARRYVTRSPEGDRYALSLKLFVLAHRHPPVNRLVARALPAMDAFTKAAEQSCHLGVYDRGWYAYGIHVVDSIAYVPGTRDGQPGLEVLNVSDPSNPVPTLGGRNLFLPSGPRDQRPNEGRDDVIRHTFSGFNTKRRLARSMSRPIKSAKSASSNSLAGT